MQCGLLGLYAPLADMILGHEGFEDFDRGVLCGAALSVLLAATEAIKHHRHRFCGGNGDNVRKNG